MRFLASFGDRTSFWAKGVDTKNDQKTFFVFPGQSVEISFGTKPVEDKTSVQQQGDASKFARPEANAAAARMDTSKQLEQKYSALGTILEGFIARYSAASKNVFTYNNYKFLCGKFISR
jgi:hypothetical protein